MSDNVTRKVQLVAKEIFKSVILVLEEEGIECNVTEKVKVSDGSDKLEKEVQELKADIEAILSEALDEETDLNSIK